MGTDKALLELGGKTLIVIAAESFTGFPEILISAADNDGYSLTGASVIADEIPGIGPLGGIISALRVAKFDYVCFRPVDAPLFPSGLSQKITTACIGKDISVPVSGGKTEPLFSCFSKTALPALERLVRDGNYKVNEAFPLLDAAFIELGSEKMVSLFGDPADYLINANDKEAFKKLGRR